MGCGVMSQLSDPWQWGPQFSASVTEADDAVELRLAGELDVAAAEELGEALSVAGSASAGPLVVDVSNVTFIDAGGLRPLLTAHHRLVEEGRAGLRVRGATALVLTVFEITSTMWLLEGGQPSMFAGDRRDVSSSDCRRLDTARRQVRISPTELFVDYFALGGTADLSRMQAHLHGVRFALDAHQHDVAIHALNERLIALGREDGLLSYVSDAPPGGA